MKNIVICGFPGRGKSYKTKEILADFQKNTDGSPRLNYMFDLNKEYTMFPNEVNKHFKKFPGIVEFKEFIIERDIEGANIVFEEATAFFSNSGSIDQRTLNLLSRRFHTQNLNIFLFHSLRKIPLDIMDFVDFFFLYRTEDMPGNVEKKFKDHPKLIECYLDVRAKTNGTQFDRERKIYLPGSYTDDVTGQVKHVTAEYSKAFFHYKRTIAT